MQTSTGQRISIRDSGVLISVQVAGQLRPMMHLESCQYSEDWRSLILVDFLAKLNKWIQGSW